MVETLSGKDVTLDILVAVPTTGIGASLSLSQDAIISAFKAAGNDMAGLASKLAVPITYLSITGAKVVTAHGYDAIQITIAVNSGDPVKVLSEIAGAGAGMISGYAIGVATTGLLSFTPLTPGGAAVVGSGVGIIGGALAGNQTKVEVANYLNGNLAGEPGGEGNDLLMYFAEMRRAENDEVFEIRKVG